MTHATKLELNTRAFAPPFVHIPFIPVGRTKECQECAHILLQVGSSAADHRKISLRSRSCSPAKIYYMSFIYRYLSSPLSLCFVAKQTHKRSLVKTNGLYVSLKSSWLYFPTGPSCSKGGWYASVCHEVCMTDIKHEYKSFLPHTCADEFTVYCGYHEFRYCYIHSMETFQTSE